MISLIGHYFPSATDPGIQRLTEATFWKSFHADYAAILGALLDAVAKGMEALPSIALKRVPRMADFAHWGEAVGRGLGWPENAFLKSYLGSRKAADFASIEDSMVANVLIGAEFIREEYTASLARLHGELTNYLVPQIARSAEWPKCARTLVVSFVGSRHSFARRVFGSRLFAITSTGE